MTTVTPLPTPPSRQDAINFSARADTFLGALPVFGTELNLVAGEVNTNATNATTAASTATTQAWIATTKASEALTSANNAANSVVAASNWATLTSGPVSGGEYSAKYYAQQAAVSVESYQGGLPSDPTLDKNGNPLSAGDWYINTTTGFIRAYTGSAWVQGLSSVSGVSSLNGLTGDLAGFTTNSGTQTLTNKTIQYAIFTDGYKEEVTTFTGQNIYLHVDTGPILLWNVTGNSSITDGLNSGESIIIGIDDGASYTITWPSVVWTKAGGSGAAPSLSTTVKTWVVLWKVGTTLYGSYLGDA